MTMIHEEVQTLSPLVRRITANNPGVFTGSGTNTYLLGQDEVTVIDPGPAVEEHCETIIQSAKRIGKIIVTHTHLDHSPGAKILGDKLDVPIYGLVSENLHQDTSFKPTDTLKDGEVIETPEFCLTVLHTPGHASNHFCFILENEGMLFSGDHIMDGSTVVIRPPDGNMRHYLDSLKKLKKYPIQSIAPGHGNIIHNPLSMVDWILQHRIDRENKIFDTLTSIKHGNAHSMVSLVYDDVDASLHPFAKWSLEAHLIKLFEEHKISLRGDQYYI